MPPRRPTSALWLSPGQRAPRRNTRRRLLPNRTSSLALGIVVLGLVAIGGSASAAGTGLITGSVFQDSNRNGVQDASEAPLANQQLYLFDGSGQYVRGAYSDSAGHYQFSGLTDGAYRVEFASTSWSPLRKDWVPTTTGSLYPRLTVAVSGVGTADFGLRQIVRSTDVSSPISSYTGASGLRVQSYDDVVSAQEIYEAAMQGTVGAEAQYVTIRFDYSATSTTAASWQGSPGSYSGYQAICYDNYLSWLNQRDVGVGHEYGHAWSLYYDTVVQQEGTFASYLKARGLYGDSRLNSSEAWNVKELIAEDYRQLLGSPSARNAAQMNRDIPAASDVPGLADFLANTFTTPPAAAPAPPPVSPPAPSLAISGLSVSPTPVTKSANVSFLLSTPAPTTVTIVNSKGLLVRTLASGAAEPAGLTSIAWDRKSSNGQRVKSGTYTATVNAVDSSGNAVVSSIPFRVS
jgi:hypothetical protein